MMLPDVAATNRAQGENIENYRITKQLTVYLNGYTYGITAGEGPGGLLTF